MKIGKIVVDAPRYFAGSGDIVVTYLGKSAKSKKPKGQSKMMVEKNFDNLSAKDVRENWALVETAIRQEIRSFYDMETFKLSPRADAINICSARWIFN